GGGLFSAEGAGLGGGGRVDPGGGPAAALSGGLQPALAAGRAVAAGLAADAGCGGRRHAVAGLFRLSRHRLYRRAVVDLPDGQAGLWLLARWRGAGHPDPDRGGAVAADGAGRPQSRPGGAVEIERARAALAEADTATPEANLALLGDKA